jgi:amino acid adenylation domain-containing protein
VLEETQVPVLLTQKRLVEQLPPHESRLICLDTDWDAIAKESEENPVTEVTPQHLAYVMYTSGSTGKPKGVEITHANVCPYIDAISKVLQVDTNDVYLHTASFSFSSSVRQLMVPLTQGATSIIATEEQRKNPLSLFELIQKQGVTISDTVPSVWRYGLQALEALDKVSREALLNFRLRLIIFTGELTSCKLLKQLRNQLKNQPRFFNVYGQTETIGNCAYPLPEDFDREEGYIPVGYPYPHNQAYILDEYLQPVAVGEIGELHMAGACLARGYLNRSELNAAKFISNPFVETQVGLSEPAKRLFKTGDLARYLPDGAIEIVGRVDFQVKLRGMRIELGEIESVLEQHPSVKEVVVTAREDESGEKHLVGYIVPTLLLDDIDQTTFTRELRHFLQEKLADYMIPSAFVMLSTLPLTPMVK